ncbi:hypothetical protein GCM10009861_16800 [Neomicrococcus aestuarii]
MPREAVTSFTLRVGARSDRGLVRPLNEDSLLLGDGIFGVCDGMGGHEAGEVASRMCAHILKEAYDDAAHRPTSALVASYLRSADDAIRTAIHARGGTTVSGLALVTTDAETAATGADSTAGEADLQWCVFNVGDSRTYRVTPSGALAQITRDHSQVQELVALGQLTQEQAAVHPRRHVITRALGAGDAAEADLWNLPVVAGERFLVCSDGLSGEVHEETIAEVLSQHADPQQAADRLILLAIESGGRDNISVVVVDVLEDSTAD